MASIQDRIFVRKGRQSDRLYIDLRDIDGGQRALIPPDSRRALTAELAEADPELVQELAEAKLAEALAAKKRQVKGGPKQVRRLEEYATYHIEQKERAGQVTDLTLSKYRLALLDSAVDYFGPDRRLTSIDPADLQGYLEYLRAQPNGRGDTLSESTIKWRLDCLGNMYARAVSESVANRNPVRDLFRESKPNPEKQEADYLEPGEAALVLEAARLYEPERDRDQIPLHPLIATFLLTGCRRAEVLGLRVEDVDFENELIHIRPNEHRRLKTDSSHRTVPMWSQLKPVLRDHIWGQEEALDDLLFPSPRTGRMLTDLRGPLDKVAEMAGLDRTLRTKCFRHTYTSMRLQTLDAGAPVSVFTVSRELGHSSTSMVERRYGHVTESRIRSEEVEFPELEDRLQALREAS